MSDLARPTPAARLVVRVKNNRLIRAREEMGYTTQKAAADATGVNHQTWSGLECLRVSAWCREGRRPTETAQRIADHLGLSVDWLFQADGVGCIPISIPLSAPAMQRLMVPDDGDRLERAELIAILRKAMTTISEREGRLLALYFGLGSEDEHTFAEIGAMEGMSPQNAEKILLRAITRLRHVMSACTGARTPDETPSLRRVLGEPNI